MKQYETKLDPQKETQFWGWLDKMATSGKIKTGDYQYYKQNGYGYDYDFRRAFQEGQTPGKDGHWKDTGKKPNHPTFSTESVYATAEGARPGKWEGSRYIPYREPANKVQPKEYNPGGAWRPGTIQNTPLIINGKEVKPDRSNGLTQPKNVGLFQMLKTFSDIRVNMIPEEESAPNIDTNPYGTAQVLGSNG